MKWVHRRCSGVKGSLQTVRGEGQPTGSECSTLMKWVHRRCSGVKGSLQAESAAFI